LKVSIPKNFSTYIQFIRLEFFGHDNEPDKVYIELDHWLNIDLNSVMRLSVTYLRNPYKSQCNYYDTNQNPFNSVSYRDCFDKCMITNCLIKYKCVIPNHEYIIRRLDESSNDLKVECNQNEHEHCHNLFSETCKKICPVDCLSEYHYPTSYATFHENKNLKVLYYFWDSREVFISYKETADILLIDYLTYIGGLFGLWFGICLESLLGLILQHTRNLRTKVKVQVEKILSLIYIFSICVLHCINDLIISLMNYLTEKFLSIKTRISQFRICLSDWLEFLFIIILTHARIWRFKLKLCVKTLFSFTLTLIQLFIVLFVSFIFCSKSMFETQVKKLLLMIFAFFNYILKCIHHMIVMCINYVQNKNYCTHNRVESINL
jgi:hypothetical protein